MKNFLYSLFMGLFGIAGLTSIAFLLMYAAQSIQQAHLYSDLAAVRKQDTQQEIASQSSVQPTSRNLYLENSDMVGWIQIEGTSIDYPVMQTPADPNYYLKHDFEKHYTDYGCPFMQADCDALCPSDNLIIYGHNMKDGTMFGRLAQYEKNLEYLKAHAFIDFSTLWHQERYVVFAVLDVSLDVGDDRFVEYFAHPTFKSDEEFERYIRRVELASLYAIPMDVKPTDALLTLSTCGTPRTDTDARFALLAERVEQTRKN